MSTQPPPTAADVRANPAYWIAGAGYALAAATSCPHGYTLVDSCPSCDADADAPPVGQAPPTPDRPCRYADANLFHEAHTWQDQAGMVWPCPGVELTAPPADTTTDQPAWLPAAMSRAVVALEDAFPATPSPAQVSAVVIRASEPIIAAAVRGEPHTTPTESAPACCHKPGGVHTVGCPQRCWDCRRAPDGRDACRCGVPEGGGSRG